MKFFNCVSRRRVSEQFCWFPWDTIYDCFSNNIFFSFSSKIFWAMHYTNSFKFIELIGYSVILSEFFWLISLSAFWLAFQNCYTYMTKLLVSRLQTHLLFTCLVFQWWISSNFLILKLHKGCSLWRLLKWHLILPVNFLLNVWKSRHFFYTQHNWITIHVK